MWRLFVLFFVAAASAELSLSQIPASCPAISVLPPAGIVQPGEKFLFTGAVEGEMPKNVSFQWEVSGGRIVEGQGTLKLTADADWRPDGVTITATLKVLGLPAACPISYSVTGGITGPHRPILVEEFGRRPKADIEAILRKLFVELGDNPNNQGYIILYGTDKEMTARERLIINSINVRRFPTERTTIVRGGTLESGKVYTKPYRVPPGADNPVP
jgi:hypothetical protein